MPNEHYPWDFHSDQPHVLKDKSYKRRLYKLGLGSSLKTFLYIPFLPLFGLWTLFCRKYKTGQKITNVGLGVNLSQAMPGQRRLSFDEIKALVDELGVDDILIRVPLSDCENISSYKQFIQGFSDRRVLVNVLQDRRHIEDKAIRECNIRRVFSELNGLVDTYQIGNSINRKKWGFISTSEYFDFYRSVQSIRDDYFPHLRLLGGSIIDFELPNYARAVFHGSSIHYDGVGVQLYVDRRGAPENTQFHFDLAAKIQWFYEMARLSWKTKAKLYITEVNWPLVGTEPYAPAVGDCMVDEQAQARYLVRYYLLAIASGRVEKCYWHQLVAPGYGLIDNRGTELRKRKAFYCLKTLFALLNDGRVVNFKATKQGCYILVVEQQQKYVTVLWSQAQAYTGSLEVEPSTPVEVMDIVGQALSVSTPNKQGRFELSIAEDPVYVVSQKQAPKIKRISPE